MPCSPIIHALADVFCFHKYSAKSTRMIFFFNTKVKGLVPCALPSLSMLHYHHSRLCLPPPPQTLGLTWVPGGQNFWLGWAGLVCTNPWAAGRLELPAVTRALAWAATPQHGRAEWSDGTCLGLNSQCFPRIFATNTLIRSYTQPLIVSLSLFVQ